MSSCELCGKKDSVYICEIEGTSMKVCEDCSRFGKVKGHSNVRVVIQESKKPEIKETEYAFVQGYGSLVKNGREKLELNQEDFAKKINVHKSLVHQVESEHIKPSVDLARKFEKFLHIKIVNEITEDNTTAQPKDNKNNNNRNTNDSDGFTLGDMINVRKK